MMDAETGNQLVEQRRLGELAALELGYQFRSKILSDPDGEIAVVQMRDLDGDRLGNQADMAKVRRTPKVDRYLLREGDLLVRVRGANNGAALVENLDQATIHVAPLIRLRVRNTILAGYLLWFLNSLATQRQLHSMQRGTYVPSLPVKQVLELLVPVPSLKRQEIIADLAQLGTQESILSEALLVQRKTMLDRVLEKAARNSR